MGVLHKKTPTIDAGQQAQTDIEPVVGIEANAPESDLAKLTIFELRAIARKRNIGIARIRTELLAYIRDKDMGVDLASLKGKPLLERCRELHVSRLRSKHDLIRLLQA